MSDSQASRAVLWLTASILVAFGLVVGVMAVAARLRGRRRGGVVTKYLAWLVMLPPIILPLVLSRTLFQVVVLLLSLQCIREFARVTGLWRDRAVMWVCYALTGGIYAAVLGGWYGLHQAAPAVAVGLLLLVPIARGRYEHMLQKVCLSILAVLYFGWFLSHFAYLRSLGRGVAYAFFLMVLVECNDALGYLWGSWLGRRKLSPRISPSKTVEGAVLAGASVVVLSYALGRTLLAAAPGGLLLLGLLTAVLGVCGDLVVSFIKRDLRVKDMGAAIPGHGGFLDRLDSLVLTAPVFFHLVRCFYEA